MGGFLKHAQVCCILTVLRLHWRLNTELCGTVMNVSPADETATFFFVVKHEDSD